MDREPWIDPGNPSTVPPENVSVKLADASLVPATDAVLRLPYLDGLRGLAALYVVLDHASAVAGAQGRLPAIVSLSVRLLSYGHSAVAVFIVLSGYCLMLPVARSSKFAPRGGVLAFLRRRARRIMPPYYAATLISLLAIRLLPSSKIAKDLLWSTALPAINGPTVLSHLLLIHNVSAEWCRKIDPPLWSIATEWQIYFLFPFVLLPCLRRFGSAAMLIIGILMGFVPHFLLNGSWRIEQAAPWYIGLFALGIVAALLCGGADGDCSRGLSSQRLAQFTFVGLVITMYTMVRHGQWWWTNLWLGDTLLGLLTAGFLVYCGSLSASRKGSMLLSALQSRSAVWLGTISYSLYLIHFPILASLCLLIPEVSLSAAWRAGLIYSVFVPITIGISYLFYLAFERRAMSVEHKSPDGHHRAQP